MRTFIAIELPRQIIEALGKLQDSLKSANLNIRWVRPENIHLTLKFLGDIHPEAVDPISRTLSESARNFKPISLSAKGGGAFPGIKHPRVIWVGLAGQVIQLKALQGTLEDNLDGLGFEKEKRSFKSHLTIGRVKGAIDPVKLNTALNQLMEFSSQPFLADRIVLFQSELKPTGPVYTKLVSAELAPSL